MVNVTKYTIHGAYGKQPFVWCDLAACQTKIHTNVRNPALEFEKTITDDRVLLDKPSALVEHVFPTIAGYITNTQSVNPGLV